MDDQHPTRNLLDQLENLLNRYDSTNDHLTYDQIQTLLHRLKTNQQQQTAQLEKRELQLIRLQQENQLYRQLFTAAPVGYVVANTAGEVQYVNQTLLTWLGVERAALEANQLSDFIEPADHLVYNDHWHALIKSEQNQNCEVTLQLPNGRQMYVRLNSMFLPEEEYCQTAVTDMTHLYHAKEAYTKLIDNSPIAFAIMRHGQVLQANQATADLLGYDTPEELTAMSPEQFMGLVHPDSREMLINYHKARFAGEQVPNYHEYKSFRKDGTLIWIQMHLSTISYQGEMAVQCASADITERKLAEERQNQLQDELEQLVEARTAALSKTNKQLQDEITQRQQVETMLRQSETSFRSLAENSSDFITRLDRDSTHLYANPAYLQAMHLSIDEVIGKTNTDLGVPPETQRNFDVGREHVFIHKKPYSLDFAYEIDGDVFHFNTRINPEFDVDGTIKSLLTVTRDITERKQAETQALELAVEKEKANVIEQFLRDASHDLRTPLTGILSTSYLLKQTDLNEKQAKWINRLENQAQRLKNILDEMFNIVRLDLNRNFELTTTQINLLCERILYEHRQTIKQQQLTVRFQPAASLPDVLADPYHLGKAFTAVLRNALDYTHTTGEVTIRTAIDQQNVIIEIRDNGIGITADDLPHVFKRFYRGDQARGTHKGGGGLGLSVAHTIIEKHQGTITLTSEVDVGTTVQISLPITK